MEVLILDFMLHIFVHTLEDTWLMVPLLFITYYLLEKYAHSNKGDDHLFKKLQKYGPLLGAFLGLLPQCGFSVLAAALFVQKHITIGTLIAMFIATSDEAIPIFLAMPEMHVDLVWLLGLKVSIGILVGWLCDHVLFKNQTILPFVEDEDVEIAHVHCSCSEHKGSVLKNVLYRTFKIYGFVFLTAYVFTITLHAIGNEALSKILLTNTMFQPIVAALFGLIPNCCASVVLCQLYALEQLSFGSLLAGLISNAGLGWFVLFEMNAGRKNIVKVLSVLLLTAIVCGLLL